MDQNLHDLLLAGPLMQTSALTLFPGIALHTQYVHPYVSNLHSSRCALKNITEHRGIPRRQFKMALHFSKPIFLTRAHNFIVHLKPRQLSRTLHVACKNKLLLHIRLCVVLWVAVCYCRHCDDIGPSVILPLMRTRKKMIAYPSMPLKARCLYIVYPSQSTPDHLY